VVGMDEAAEQARRNLAAQGIENVHIVDGDGTEGAPARAPYDAILVSAAFPHVPEPLVDQLGIGGRLVDRAALTG
jgi:protein-L-isoaspartate(D-aspartate) O-methyltransferase